MQPSISRSQDLLARRIAELDNESRSGKDLYGLGKLSSLLIHFASVMSDVTDTFMKAEAGRGAFIDPSVADKMIEASHLLHDIAIDEPSLVDGPLEVDGQHWIAIARDVSAHNFTQPQATNFIDPAVSNEQISEIQPQNIGMYTSTSTSTGRSMWREYLELFRDSGLHPLPWYIWEMQVKTDGIRIAEITQATEWVELVHTHPQVKHGLVYPDWVSISGSFDAVHFTLPAIAAVQGFYFYTLKGLIPPVFWDVETTFWLKWRFSKSHLMDTVVGEEKAQSETTRS